MKTIDVLATIVEERLGANSQTRLKLCETVAPIFTEARTQVQMLYFQQYGTHMKPPYNAMAFLLIFLVMSALFHSVEARSDDKKKGQETYKANCEGCHPAGKNTVKEGKDIVTSKNIASLTDFENFLREKHGLMPAFPVIANNKDIVQPLFKYVKTLKDQDWEYEPEASDKTPVEPAKKGPKGPTEPQVKQL